MNDPNQNLYRGADNTALRFFYRPVKADFLSEQLGRLVYHTALIVEVITPGNNESVPEFMVELKYCEDAPNGLGGTTREYEPYATRYAEQIKSFKSQNGEFLQEGMPLSQWPQIDVGTVASLRACGIFTVEQLAGVSDGNLHNIGTGGRTLREKAQQYITSREFGVPVAQTAGEIAELRQQIAMRDATIADLQAQLAAMRATPAPQSPEFGDFRATEGQTGFSAPPPPTFTFDPLAGLGEDLPEPAPTIV